MFNQSVANAKAFSQDIIFAPNAMILLLLCSRDINALNSSAQSAQRIPSNLFAAIEMPIPVPQINIPAFTSPEVTALATAFA